MVSNGRGFRVQLALALALGLACGCSNGGGGGAPSDAAGEPGDDTASMLADLGGRTDASDATKPNEPDQASGADLSDAASGNRDTVATDAGVSPADAGGVTYSDGGVVLTIPAVAEDPTLMDPTDYGTSTGFRIILDYRYDTSAAFTREKRLVLRAAAATWESVIASDFAPVAAGTSIRVVDPQKVAAGGSATSVDYAIDDLLVFAGFGSIDGEGGTLARAAGSVSLIDLMLQGDLFARHTGNPYQPWVSSVSVDTAESFFFDATLDTSNDVPTSNPDFYSIVLHELGHALGLPAATAFSQLVSNGTFTGSHAVAVHGGPVPLTSDGHVSSEVRSAGVSSLMAPSQPRGLRAFITPLDLAMLEDIGYTIRR